MNWPRVQLGKIALDLQPGFACRPSDGADSFSQLRTNNVSSEGRIDLGEVKAVPAKASQVEKYCLCPGDVLFNNTNSPALVGKTAYFEETEPYLFSNHMTRIRLDTSIMDARFAARFLHWTWKTGGFRKLVTQWVNQAAINRTQIASVRVPVPALSEQRRIVEVLDQADALRKLRAEADAKAERILPALFIKLFGEPGSWRSHSSSRPLGDLVDLASGATPSKRNGKFWDGEIPWVSPKDMKVDFITDSQDHVSALALEKTNLKLVDPDNVLLVVRGMILAHSVPVALTSVPVTINQDMKALVPKGDAISGSYLWAALRVAKPLLRTLVGTAAHGTRKLDTQDLLQLHVVEPTRIQLKECEFAVTTHRTLLDARSLRQKKVKLLFDVLLHRAFTGDLTASWREAHMTELLQEMEQQGRTISAEAQCS